MTENLFVIKKKFDEVAFYLFSFVALITVLLIIGYDIGYDIGKKDTMLEGLDRGYVKMQHVNGRVILKWEEKQ